MDGYRKKTYSKESDGTHKHTHLHPQPRMLQTTKPNKTKPAYQKTNNQKKKRNTYPVTTTTLPPSVNPLSVGVKRPTRPFSNGTARLVVDPPPSALVFPSSSSLAGVWIRAAGFATGRGWEGEGCFEERREKEGGGGGVERRVLRREWWRGRGSIVVFVFLFMTEDVDRVGLGR